MNIKPLYINNIIYGFHIRKYPYYIDDKSIYIAVLVYETNERFTNNDSNQIYILKCNLINKTFSLPICAKGPLHSKGFVDNTVLPQEVYDYLLRHMKLIAFI